MPTFRALRYPNFRLYYAGQIVSLTGSWMQQIAQAWLMYRLTGSPFLLGLVSFANRAPVFFLAIPMAVYAERIDRRRLLVVMQAAAMLQALALAVITLAGWVTPLIVIVFALALGLISAVDMPARQTFVGDLVSVQDMPSAVGLNATAVNAARIVGPALAGIVVAGAGEGWAFLINAVSFSAVLAGLLRMRGLARTARAEHEGGGFRARLVGGVVYIREHRRILVALGMVAMVSLTGMPYITLLPAFAAERLGGGAALLGWLMTASGMGALFGAVFLAGRQAGTDLLRWVMASAAVMGVGLVAMGFASGKYTAMAALFVVGGGMMLALASANTFIQTRVAPEFRQRVMSMYSVAFVGLAPFGALLGGSAAELWPVHWVIAATGALTLVAAAAMTFQRYDDRNPRA